MVASHCKVVIVGGGFGGLSVAQHLGKKIPEIVIIDKTNHHLFQPLLYQVASAALSPGQIAIPIREIVSGAKNISVVMAEVVDIDKTKQILTLASGHEVSYDYLILAPGARHSYFGHDEWEPLAPGLKTIQDAISIREKILQSFEKAERSDTPEEAEKYLNFVVIGGGPTGVELSGAIAEIAHRTMLKNFRHIDTEKTKIFLVEGHGNILKTFPDSLAKSAYETLTQMGVKILIGGHVSKIDIEGVHIGETYIPSTNVFWAAGNKAAPIVGKLGAEMDRAGRVKVKPDLSIEGFSNIFVIGDAAHAIEPNTKEPLPGVATVAIQQGSYIANIIKHEIKNPNYERRPFKYWDKGMMATVGRSHAILQMGKIKMSGFFAWLAWCFVHLVYLIGFRNKIQVLFEWMIWYFSGHRGARLINSPLDEIIKVNQNKIKPSDKPVANESSTKEKCQV